MLPGGSSSSSAEGQKKKRRAASLMNVVVVVAAAAAVAAVVGVVEVVASGGTSSDPLLCFHQRTEKTMKMPPSLSIFSLYFLSLRSLSLPWTPSCVLVQSSRESNI